MTAQPTAAPAADATGANASFGAAMPERAAGLPAHTADAGPDVRAGGGPVQIRPFGRPRPFAERRGALLLALSFLLMVVIPVAVAAVYYLFVAADQYVVEFRFGVRGLEPAPIGLGAPWSASLVPSPIASDSYAVVQYIESRAIVDDLGLRIDLKAIFSRPAADWVARLRTPAPIEELVRYWRGQVDAFYDATDRSVTVTVRAFTPRDALALARGVLAAAERLINNLSARARRDTLAHAQADLENAETRLARALARLRSFRDQQGVIDPRQTANATEALAGKVRAARVRAQTELDLLERYMDGGAPALKLLRARIKALAAQERSLAGEITSKEQTRARILSRVMTSYEELASERRFAETAYQHALLRLDRARRDADRQQVYLATFVRPSLPEEPLYPRRLFSIGIVFLAAFAIWAIGSLIVQSIRDHL
jgi:capsular polysaccharide transport system permease protein